MSERSSRRRRNVLKAAGIFSVLVAGGAVWRALDQGVFSTGEGPAYEPWLDWRGEPGEGSMALVRAAILAANPHNTQPWLFRVSESRVDLYSDPKRNIGAIDPDLREMYVGLGCALENLMLAASAKGYAPELKLFPDPASHAHVAQVELAKGPSVRSVLYEAIASRHTNRGAYDTGRRIGAEVWKAVQELGADMPDVRIFWFADDEQRDRMGRLIVEATQAVIADPQQSQDSARWERFDWHALQRQRDGITLDAQGLSPAVRVAAKMLPALSPEQSNQAWLTSTREVFVGKTNTFGILAVRSSHDRAQRIRGGRLWQRLHLWGTSHGLAMQPLNQMSERADRERQLALFPTFGNALKELVADPNWQALMPFRIGYPQSEALPSPRRALKEVIL